MNRKTRLIIAVIITLVLAVAATTVWAGSKEGSLKGKIHDLKQACNTTINMGDATFTMTVAGKKICEFEVTRTKVPNAEMGGAPEGLEFRSDGFIVTGGPDDGIGMLEACFAYSPQDEAKNAQIYALLDNQLSILPAIKQGPPTQLCAATTILNGIFALVGDPQIKP
jgi:hypothetical protein